jgi:hypothetical protein
VFPRTELTINRRTKHVSHGGLWSVNMARSDSKLVLSSFKHTGGNTVPIEEQPATRPCACSMSEF